MTAALIQTAQGQKLWWNVSSWAFDAKYGDHLMTVEAEDEYDARYVASRLSSWPMSGLSARLCRPVPR